MRLPALLLAVLVLPLAACQKKVPEEPVKPTEPTVTHQKADHHESARDASSYAEPDKVVIKHLALDLDVDRADLGPGDLPDQPAELLGERLGAFSRFLYEAVTFIVGLVENSPGVGLGFSEVLGESKRLIPVKKITTHFQSEVRRRRVFEEVLGFVELFEHGTDVAHQQVLLLDVHDSF